MKPPKLGEILSIRVTSGVRVCVVVIALGPPASSLGADANGPFVDFAATLLAGGAGVGRVFDADHDDNGVLSLVDGLSGLLDFQSL